MFDITLYRSVMSTHLPLYHVHMIIQPAPPSSFFFHVCVWGGGRGGGGGRVGSLG